MSPEAAEASLRLSGKGFSFKFADRTFTFEVSTGQALPPLVGFPFYKLLVRIPDVDLDGYAGRRMQARAEWELSHGVGIDVRELRKHDLIHLNTVAAVLSWVCDEHPAYEPRVPLPHVGESHAHRQGKPFSTRLAGRPELLP